MINLLSTSQKEEIRAARRNVQLRKYTLLGIFVTIGIFAIYGVGFYVVMNQKESAQQQLNQDRAAAIKYKDVQKNAKDYKTNLAIANKVLSSGISYSKFLTDIASSLPAGSVLTDLALTNLGGSSSATPGLASSAITLHVRTTSYGTALLVKKNLEESPVFENVSIANVQQVDITSDSTELEKKYPFTLTVSATVTKQKVVK